MRRLLARAGLSLEISLDPSGLARLALGRCNDSVA
jgi:hypothetical protein